MIDSLRESVEIAQRDEAEFRALLPKRGLIHEYMRYTDRQESPGSFHFWAIATVIGACLQRRTWVSKGIYPVFPNLYTILVAPTGKCRKTRAVSLALSIADGFDWLNVIADKTSGEAFLEALMVGTQAMVGASAATGPTIIPPDSSGLLKAPELAVLLGKETYASGMVDLLTDLYDCPDDFKYVTRNKKPITLHNVVVQMLGCTTPSWFSHSLPEDSFGGGFMSRFIFVVKEQRDRIITMPEAPQPDEKQSLRRELLSIRGVSRGEMRLTPEAYTWFDNWYRMSAMQPIDDNNLVGFIERKPDTVLKLALILASTYKQACIDLSVLKQAFDIVSWTQGRAFAAFAHVNLSTLGKLKMRILDFITCRGGRVSRRDVLRKFSGQFPNGVMDMVSIERLLTESGEIETPKQDNRCGRPTIFYQLTKKEVQNDKT
jgi:hypothetical protein